MQLSTYVVFIFAHNQGYSNSCTNLGVSQTELMPSGSSIPKHTYTYVCLGMLWICMPVANYATVLLAHELAKRYTVIY